MNTVNDMKFLIALLFLCSVVSIQAETECVCTLELKQVCGSDGVTYDNPCLATCHGASVVNEHACEHHSDEHHDDDDHDDDHKDDHHDDDHHDDHKDDHHDDHNDNHDDDHDDDDGDDHKDDHHEEDDD